MNSRKGDCSTKYANIKQRLKGRTKEIYTNIKKNTIYMKLSLNSHFKETANFKKIEK